MGHFAKAEWHVALRNFQKSKYHTGMDDIKALIQVNAQMQESDEG